MGRHVLVAAVVSLALVLAPAPALAGAPSRPGGPIDAVRTFTFSPNMHPLGFSARAVPPTGTGAEIFNTDLVFSGRTAYQGTYEGFRIIDVTRPDHPVEVNNYAQCSPGTTAGNQGDLLVWHHLLIRSWNSPVSAANAATASCGGQLVGQGFEGIHIFDVSNPRHPVLLAQVRMAADTTPAGCGSHTATLVPDVRHDNLYVYDSASSARCPGIDVVRIPIANPSGAEFLREVPSGRNCHDTAVIQGTVNLVACAGGNGFTVWSIDPSMGASIENPVQLYSQTIPGVTVGHSVAFTWDGEVLVFGHEPGGGAQPRCQATSSVVDRSLFFFDARTGDPLGTFVNPRPQTALENCTWHNYNVVPTERRHVLVSGNYQSGVSVVDFTDPADAREIAFADPAPLVNPTDPSAIELGGDWSTYWYDGRIYESDITRGLIIWRLGDRAVAGARHLDHLNPQTEETSFPSGDHERKPDRAAGAASFAAAVAGSPVLDGQDSADLEGATR